MCCIRNILPEGIGDNQNIYITMTTGSLCEVVSKHLSVQHKPDLEQNDRGFLSLYHS